MDVPSFLRMCPPFDDLGEDRLAEVVQHTHIEFFPAGAQILQASGEPSRFLYVVRRGAVEVLDGDEAIDVLGEREVFGFVSLLSGVGPSFSIRAHEDAICYLVEKEIAESVMASRRGLTFLASAFRRRDMRALSGVERERIDERQVPVGTLARRRPLSISAAASIREVAELMAGERESFVLLEGRDNDGLAIITDRDLRSRALAEGRSPESSADAIASSPVVTVPSDATMGEVMALMLERGIHHIPVQDTDGSLLGVVTDIDLLAAEQHGAFALKKDIERAPDRAGVVEAFGAVPEVASRLVEASVQPLEVAHIVAVAVDALTVRMLDLGVHELGEPPCPWAWLVLGSEARQEQGLVTDQENAMMFDPGDAPAEEVDAYFARLGAFVNDGLEEAGIPKGRAGAIASNVDWRGSVEGWQDRFRGWISDPGHDGSAFNAVAFDYRPLAGQLDARMALDEIIRSAREHPDFIRHLGAHAVVPRPPKGLLKAGGGVHAKTTTGRLDMQQTGIGLITDVARLLAMMSGLSEIRTLRRLRDVSALGWLSHDEREGLAEAFGLMWQVRLEHQARCVQLGLPVDDLVQPDHIGPLTRQALKEAFRMVDRAQDRLGAFLGLRR